jgi:hypothetical protein
MVAGERERAHDQRLESPYGPVATKLGRAALGAHDSLVDIPKWWGARNGAGSPAITSPFAAH